MDYLGKWKLKSMLTVGERGFQRMDAAEIEAMEERGRNAQAKRMLGAVFIITESALDIYVKAEGEELSEALRSGKTVNENGLLYESFPARIENGLLWLDYTKRGDYSPCEIDEEGVLSISLGVIKIQKA